jgi:hypothetical protein
VTPFSAWGGQRPLEECLIHHHLIVDQMFLDDPLNDCWSSCLVPDTLGVDNHDRALLANAEAISLGAEDATGAFRCRFVQSQFLEAAFEVGPGLQAGGFVAAEGFGLVGADEDMAIDFVQAEFRNCGLEGSGFGIDRGRGSGF